MTKIDFHILPTLQSEDVFHYVARLAQKALGKDHRVLIAAENPEQSSQISQALWAFQPESFLSHTAIADVDHSLQISDNNQCGEHHDILINLCAKTPDYFSRFGRVFEVVCQQPEWLTSSRLRYRFYNDHGYEIKRHDLRDRV
jgi:DNA polymerase-3 subunit chi